MRCSVEDCDRLVALSRNAVRCDEHRDTDHRDELEDAGTSPVVGVLLMLPIAVSLALSVMLWAGAFEQAVDEQRKTAEVASWCSRHPDEEWPGERDCPSYGPRGWTCDPAEVFPESALKCVPVDGDEDTSDYTVVKGDPDGINRTVQTR